eukprot:scaffold2.g6816.t1
MAPRNSGKSVQRQTNPFPVLVAVVVVVAVALVLGGGSWRSWAAHGGRRAPTAGAGAGVDLFESGNGSFGLRRAAAAVFLEHAAAANPVAGVCHEQRAVLPDASERVCRNLHCLWSDAAGANVDLWLQPLRALPEDSVAGRCPRPAGGQGPLPAGAAPAVSFVVTMHNNAEVTAQCLLELFRTAHEAESAEIVLVDDGSTEDVGAALETVARLRRLFGMEIVVLRNAVALGYGPANTRGIDAARGEFVALINNDMFVVKGWLTALLETFKLRPKAGMVGPLFIGRNSIVQEAGGLVFNDASAANYGRGQTLNHWLNYLRVTDYISAACVVFRKSLFQKLGGFDTRYEKGYYEDTDLALSVASAGYEVLFQPLAVVYHQEGTTFGTDESSEVKRTLMARNKAAFLGKWQATLQDAHCPPRGGNRMAATRAGSPKLLWVDDIVPEPDKDSGSVRAMNLLRILLAEGYHVSFAPSAWRDHKYSALARMQGVHVVPAAKPEEWTTEEVGFLVDPSECIYDAILVARRTIYQRARDALAAACPGVPIIYDTVDLHFLREARDVISALNASAKSGAAAWDFDRVGTAHVVEWLEAQGPESTGVRERRDMELELIDNSQAIVVVSEDEIDVIRHYRPDATVMVISNIHEVPEQQPTSCAGRDGLLFVGNMNHPPNWQAVHALLEQVLPHLLERLPAEAQADFMIHIVGANVVPPHVRALIEAHKQYVTFHGFLPDDELFILYRRVRVVVAPLLSGAGVKGKVNQAMKLGVPIVSTPLGVEGMHVRDGLDGLVARSPSEFAAKVVQAYTDCRLWQRLMLGGYQNIKQHFSVDAARPAVLETLRHVGAGPRSIGERHKCHPSLLQRGESAGAAAQVRTAQVAAATAAAAGQQQQTVADEKQQPTAVQPTGVVQQPAEASTEKQGVTNQQLPVDQQGTALGQEAGGYGTRLRPLTLTVPKPIVDFGNKPMICHQIEAVKEAGCEEVVLAINYRPQASGWRSGGRGAAVMMEFLKEWEEKLGIKITCSQEPEPMGTAGPLALAKEILDDGSGDPFFVLNSDVICEYPLHDMLEFHARAGAEATILVTKVEDPSKYGVVVMDDAGKVDRFVEKPKTFVGDKINAGIYLINPSVLERIELRPTSIEKEVFPAIAETGRLYAMELEGYWMDVGQPKGCLIGPNVSIGRLCVIGDGVRLSNCVLLNRVKVKNYARVSDSIVGWGSSIGSWARVDNKAVIGEDVFVADEVYMNGAIVLPHKDIKESVLEPGTIIM